MNEQTIFLAALEIADPVERAAYVSRTCGGDATLRRNIEGLLAAHERSGQFLEVPALRQIAAGASEDRPSPDQTQAEHHDTPEEVDLSFLLPSTQPGSLGRLGHYEVQEVIGRGGCGIVLKAFDEILHRTVAIKVMTPELAATSPARKRFLREARAAAAIRHENVVSIHAVEEKPIPFLVMEYIAGQTLQQKLDQHGPLDVREIVQIGHQVASGLEAAHAIGLIHRDIKPGNILLEQGRDRIKITDFGLARATDDASITQSGVIAGTPLYMSPEQAQGVVIDQRSDLFSLGSVLYVMCSGRPPFRASTTMAVLKRVAEDQPRPIQEIIPEVPDWLIAIIAKLLAKKPEDRFASAQEVANLLARCLSELQHRGRVESLGDILPMISKPAIAAREPEPSANPIASESLVPAPDTRPAISRNRLWVTAAIVLLVLLGGLGMTEATGVSNVRDTVIRLFSPDGALVVKVDDPDRRAAERMQSDGDVIEPRVAVQTRGTWRIVGEVIEQPEPNQQAMLLFGSPDFGDGDFSCEALRSEGEHGLALVFRASDLENYYYFDIGVFANTYHSIYAKEAGENWRRIDQKRAEPVPTDRWVKMRLRLRGDSLEGYLDDQLVVSGKDDRRLTGYLGLRTWNETGKYRNLKFADPTGKVLWEGLPRLP